MNQEAITQGFRYRVSTEIREVYVYGENAGELKIKAFSGFGGVGGEENCKNAIGTGLWDMEKSRIDITADSSR